ncbi:MAG: right-handed parallel beta-helix repeat-containing protein [Myxococcota bacterium]
MGRAKAWGLEARGRGARRGKWLGAWAIGLAIGGPLAAEAATFVVNTTDDDGDLAPGDGACSTGQLIFLAGGQIGFECTLRAALEEANASAGSDRISFSEALPQVGGVVEIAPQSALPFVFSPIDVAGDAHPDYDATVANPRPIVNLLGGAAGAGVAGLTLSTGSDGSRIGGLAIVDFDGPGVRVSPFFGANPADLHLEGNHIGIARGVFYRGNRGHGVHLTSAHDVTIGQRCTALGGCIGARNVIAGNGGDGVLVDGASQDVGIAGNYIGLDRYGSSTFPPFGGATANAGWGVRIGAGASNVSVGSVGGQIQLQGPPLPVASGNVIAGNGEGGVRASGPWNALRANAIGTNAAGTVALPNGGDGVHVEGDDTVVGGPGLEGNLISGNAGEGILIDRPDGPRPQRTRIEGNRIGVDAQASGVLGNAARGVLTFGEDVLVRDNVIGGNADGVLVRGPSTALLGNHVGTNANGDALSNLVFGVVVRAGSTRIGAPFDGNVIGLNGTGLSISADSFLTTVEGNFVGTDPTGADLGNTHEGIAAFGQTYTIGGEGGTTNGEGNVVGYNGAMGIRAQGFEGVVQGNFIGTDALGRDLGNGGAGIRAEVVGAVGLDPAMIGGDRYDSAVVAATRGNVIANNALAGLVLAATEEVALRGNTFWSNGGIALDLGADGATPNDAGDFDIGANDRMNAPEIDPAATSWDPVTGELTVRYRVDALAAAGVAFPMRVDFFVHDPWLEPGDQARALAGSDVYPVTDEGLYRTVTFTPLPGSIAPNPLGFVFEGLRATATDGLANTSELSTRNVPVPEPTASLQLAAGGLAFARLARRRRRRFDGVRPASVCGGAGRP